MFVCRVFCGTWNVNGQEPSSDLHEWLLPQDEERLPDIYAIGSVVSALMTLFLSETSLPLFNLKKLCSCLSMLFRNLCA